MSALKEYFNYSKHERRGIFTLLTIIMGLIFYNMMIPELVNLSDPEKPDFKEEVDSFLAIQQEYERSEKIIEINTADTSDLKKLPGIGPYYAGRIIKYRELLGGYYRKEQLLEVYGMDSARYHGFHQFILVDTNKILKINLNMVEFKALLRHPYFDYEMVKGIFNYKRKVKQIRYASELNSANIVSSIKYSKIKPYLINQ